VFACERPVFATEDTYPCHEASSSTHGEHTDTARYCTPQLIIVVPDPVPGGSAMAFGQLATCSSWPRCTFCGRQLPHKRTQPATLVVCGLLAHMKGYFGPSMDLQFLK